MSQSQPQIPEVGDEFPTAENFKEMAQQGAKAAGFAFSISSSKMSGGGKGGHTPFITLQCTMGGIYRNNHKINEETRKRKKLSKRQNCPVVLQAVLNENTRTWIVTSSKSVHNHELLIPSQIHCLPQHRHLNTEQKELVHIMLKSGTSTRSTADAIHWKQSTVYTKDIINERDRIKNALNESTNHDTTMRLIKMLEERQYILRHLLTKDGHMLNLFFTYIEAARQVAICPEVLIIDATYKTNLYKLPLINTIGISNIGNAKALNTYQIAIAWVANEQEPTYEWFLFTLKETIYDIFFCSPEVFVSDRALALRKATDKVFPEAKKMICIWHMFAQNLRTTCRKFFDSDEEYNELLLAVQKVAYAEEMNEVEKAFKEISQAIMKSRDPEYIQNYLEEWKKDAKCWMHVFTKNYLHMGTQSTQRAEGSHSALKKAIEASSGLEQVFLHIDRAFRQHQLQTNEALGSNILSADPFICNDKRFELLLGKISRWAIDRIKKEVCEIDENKNVNNNSCNCSLRLNYKLPCRHIILPTGPVPLNLVHKRWHLKHDSVSSIPLLLSIDMTISKVLYKLEEKYEHLNNSGSKATFLHKLETLVTEEIPVPKAPLHNVSTLPKRRSQSTKRNSLLSEHQEKATKEKSKKEKKEKNIKKLETKLVEVLQQSQQPLFYDQIPIFIHEDIKNVVNVDGDGNCGYRAVAVGLGRNENEWPNIRKELFEELNKNEPFYRSLFLANDDYDMILKEISWKSGPCTFDHWMKMPQMDDVIANAYKRPLYFFSLQISLTFLPYHHPLNRNEALAIAFVNQNHYVTMVLKPGAPVPPIVNRWTQFPTLAAARWKLLIQDRISQFLLVSGSTSKTDTKSK
ncbi:8787_t:CDS:1 [Cetraspora pellucida]|uniref:8787_t:CDS:1 n=1 Tax=Cetraspora pellucida TaxID=1433469 RepID=A0A9N9FJ49_9GLOM|nr:8787_t:CDS:1 [Cetraspora pellucida]